MSVFDGLFGRRHKETARRADALFALVTSAPDLETQGLTSDGPLGLCVRLSEGPTFDRAVDEVNQVVDLYRREHALTVHSLPDGLGSQWWVTRADAFEDAVTVIHLVADELTSRGYGDALLAVLAPFTERGHGIWYLVYNYRRGRYYPFCPTRGRERDNAREIRLASAFPVSLPKEEAMERWYPIWDPPLADV